MSDQKEKKLKQYTQNNDLIVKKRFNPLRCPKCCLPKSSCICSDTPVLNPNVQFWLVMHTDEITKYTNTGRLILNSMTTSKSFIWDRTNPPAELLSLLNNPQYQPYIIFPNDKPEYAERVTSFKKAEEGKIPVFILIDSTWGQARKIYNKSSYLSSLPILPIDPKSNSRYTLRKQKHDKHLSTVEVAIELLNISQNNKESEALANYFDLFLASYSSGRRAQAFIKTTKEIIE